MSEDPIVLETRKYREAYAAAFDYDLTRIVADLQSRQGRDGRVVVDRASEMKPNPANRNQDAANGGIDAASVRI